MHHRLLFGGESCILLKLIPEHAPGLGGPANALQRVLVLQAAFESAHP